MQKNKGRGKKQGTKIEKKRIEQDNVIERAV